MMLSPASVAEVRDVLSAGGQGNGNPIGGANGVVRPESRNLTLKQLRALFRQQLRNPKPFTMVSRQEWNARPPNRSEMEPMGAVDGVVIHHTANPEAPVGCARNGPDRWNRIRNIQTGHTRDLKYADIGYHYLIAKGCDGHWRIIEGRDTRYKGAHAGVKYVREGGKRVKKNMNDGKIGIAFSANFEDADPARPAATQGGPPAEALEQFAILMEKIKKEHPNAEVFGHGGANRSLALMRNHTGCPGDHMVAPLRATREVFGNVNQAHSGARGVDWL